MSSTLSTFPLPVIFVPVTLTIIFPTLLFNSIFEPLALLEILTLPTVLLITVFSTLVLIFILLTWATPDTIALPLRITLSTFLFNVKILPLALAFTVIFPTARLILKSARLDTNKLSIVKSPLTVILLAATKFGRLLPSFKFKTTLPEERTLLASITVSMLSKRVFSALISTLASLETSRFLILILLKLIFPDCTEESMITFL